MLRGERRRRLLSSYAELLSYPRGDHVSEARRCLSLLAGEGRPAEEPAARFLARIERAAPADLEEVYTATFDLAPACAPYLGHQLLGESPVRGAFLAKLSEVYQAEGFRPREELGDHLAEVLRFLAVAREGAPRDDLLRDGLAPALERMLASLDDRSGPWRDLVASLSALVARAVAREAAGEEARP